MQMHLDLLNASLAAKEVVASLTESLDKARRKASVAEARLLSHKASSILDHYDGDKYKIPDLIWSETQRLNCEAVDAVTISYGLTDARRMLHEVFSDLVWLKEYPAFILPKFGRWEAEFHNDKFIGWDKVY